MREIKFRAWDKTRNSWWHGSLGDVLNLGSQCEALGQYIEFHGDSWQQYTGLKDKNGVEIYEGDIVVAWNVSGKNNYRTERVRQVRWREMSKYTGFNIGTGPYSPRSIEVIGNIYENPELLS